MTAMPIVICNIKCTGDENQLADCAVLQTLCSQGYRSCSHNDDVGVSCSKYSSNNVATRPLFDDFLFFISTCMHMFLLLHVFISPLLAYLAISSLLHV